MSKKITPSVFRGTLTKAQFSYCNKTDLQQFYKKKKITLLPFIFDLGLGLGQEVLFALDVAYACLDISIKIKNNMI